MSNDTEEKVIIVTNKQFSEKYQQLNLSTQKTYKGLKKNHDMILEILKTVLNEFSIDFLPAPCDDQRLKVWHNEAKKLKVAFSRFQQAYKNHNWNGNFYNSSKYTELTKIRLEKSDLADKVIYILFPKFLLSIFSYPFIVSFSKKIQ